MLASITSASSPSANTTGLQLTRLVASAAECNAQPVSHAHPPWIVAIAVAPAYFFAGSTAIATASV
jgi:hypothetical protein